MQWLAPLYISWTDNELFFCPLSWVQQAPVLDKHFFNETNESRSILMPHANGKHVFLRISVVESANQFSSHAPFINHYQSVTIAENQFALLDKKGRSMSIIDNVTPGNYDVHWCARRINTPHEIHDLILEAI